MGNKVLEGPAAKAGYTVEMETAILPVNFGIF